MAKYYYNGVLLPEIPADVLASYPYVWIHKHSNGTRYSAIFSTVKYWYQSSDDTMRANNATVKNYWITPDEIASGSDWTFRNDSWYYWESASTSIIWANYNVPNGSASSSTIYFYRSTPIPYYDEGYLKTSARAYHAASSTTPLSISIEASAGDMLVIGIAARSEFTVPDGFTKCFTSDPCGTQTLSMVYKTITEDGLQTVAFHGTEGALTYLTAMVFRDIKKVKYTGQQYYYFQDAGTSAFSKAIRKRQDGVCTLWGITCNYALNYSESTPYDYSASPDDMEGIQSQDPLLNNVRLKMFFDDGTGAMDHTISYPMTGAYNYAIDAIELYPYDMRYLIRSGSTLYTVTDGTLTALAETEITASLFKTYGVDEIPDGVLLVGLTDPEVLYWQDSDDALPSLTASVTGMPPVPQVVITDAQDMSDPSITGIESVTVDASADVLWAISFDDGATWKAYDGTTWTVLGQENSGMTAETFQNIGVESWATAVTSDHYRVRFVLMDISSYVNQLVVHYLNEEV